MYKGFTMISKDQLFKINLDIIMFLQMQNVRLIQI